jgi:hypothetical protein
MISTLFFLSDYPPKLFASRYSFRSPSSSATLLIFCFRLVRTFRKRAAVSLSLLSTKRKVERSPFSSSGWCWVEGGRNARSVADMSLCGVKMPVVHVHEGETVSSI